MTSTKKPTWSRVKLFVSWQADRHSEYHSIEFQRPTDDNPSPEFPVEAGGELSDRRLPQSSSWRHLFATVKVKAFDKYSLTIQYGIYEHTITPDDGYLRLEVNGENYTPFELGIRVMSDENLMKITHDEAFLRRFRLKSRVMQLSKDDVEVLRKAAEKGDPYAEFGYGQWLYYNAPDDTSLGEAERLFLSAKTYLPDALAAYAMMWHYGETKENRMDIEESNKLLHSADKRGSRLAAMQLARIRIFGLFCNAELEKVATELERQLETSPNPDPYLHALLAFAYEQMGRMDDAVSQYEQAIAQGDVNNIFYLAVLYKQRGNMALYEELMEEGIEKGSGMCCIYRSDTTEEEFLELDDREARSLHDQIVSWLNIGVQRGDGYSALYLWLNYYYGCLGFNVDKAKAMAYLRQGVRLGNVSCIEKLAELAENGEWIGPPVPLWEKPKTLSATEIAELWLRAARYSPDDEDILRKLRAVGDPAFLLRHKSELEQYWQPLFEHLSEQEADEDDHDDDGKYDAWA